MTYVLRNARGDIKIIVVKPMFLNMMGEKI
jgi:hypothetical protein